MKKIVIVGNGGFAKEVKWLIERINDIVPTWEFLGFVDQNDNEPDVIGNDEFVINAEEELYVSIGIGSPEIRERLYRKFKSNPFIKFPNLIDPSVLFSDSVSFGEGNIICAGTIVTVDVSIGNCNIINLDCTVGHDAVIENYVTVNPSVNISGNTKISSGAYIGTGTQILQGVMVGSNSVIGAGAVVIQNLPENCTAVGVPAEVIKYKQLQK